MYLLNFSKAISTKFSTPGPKVGTKFITIGIDRVYYSTTSSTLVVAGRKLLATNSYKLHKINPSGRIMLRSTRCLNFQTLEFRFLINFVYKLYLVDYTKVPGSLWTAPYKPV